MGLLSIGHDEHYGYLGLGAVTLSAANAFSAAIISALIEPDLIISNKVVRGRVLEQDVDHVLVWDAKEWHFHTSQPPDISSAGDTQQFNNAGITKDNTVDGNGAPTSDIIAQGTRPGGNGAAVAGLAAGGPGNRTTGDEQPTRYVERTQFFATTNETVDATGQANHQWNENRIKPNSPYQLDGHTVHYLTTAAHYHLWGDTDALQSAAVQSLGMYTKRLGIDFKEVMFDRAVLLSILDAIVVST